MIGTRIRDRYRIDSELGQGGMGTVYRSFDTTLKRDVAVKIMNENRLGSEGSERLLREAQAIAQLSHPNIVTVFDAGEYENSPFIVMEYVEGVNLYQQPPADIEAIVNVIRQVCAALAHAHAHGIIHRDLKPENVILTAEGTAKLMDFGLARSIRSRLTSEGTIQGTVFYLAPEQALGNVIDPRSDLYSLGVMLYELTTGDLPFIADDPLAVISQHVRAPALPPRAKNDQIPPALEALILELMQKDPAARPPSASAVQMQLSAPEMLDVDAMPKAELSVLDRIVRGRMVGCEHELKQARQMWQRAIGGEGQLLLISGEAGVGKTRLVREIVTQAEVSGGQAYVGEIQEEGSAPYAAFAQIIRRAIRARKDIVSALPNLVLAELISISPNLQVDFPDIPPNTALEPESEQLRLFECVIRFFSAICKEGPLMLVLEDIQWADSGTLSLMQVLGRRCREYPIMLLGTYREVVLDEALPFHQILLDLKRKNLGGRLKLQRLDADQTRDMLAVIFDEEITPDFLTGIYTVTEGNPFFIEEVCKALVESGQVYFDGERWQRPPDMADIEIPQSIKLAILSRVSKLSRSAQEVLVNAAVIGREFDFELLRRITDKQEDDLIDCLEAALKAQLIEEVKGGDCERFSFLHALFPATMRENLSRIRRTRLHQKVAQAMEAVMPEAYQRLAYQWGEAREPGKRLNYTIKAAEQAKKMFSNKDAIRLFSQALDLIEDDGRRFELLRNRAELFGFVADREAQLSDIDSMFRLAKEQDNKENQADALLALAELFLEIDPPKALNPAEQARIVAQELGDLPRQARSAHLIGRHYAEVLNNTCAIEHLKEAIQIAREAGLKTDMITYLRFLGKAEFNLGRREAATASAHEAAALSLELNDKRSKMIGTRELATAHLATMNYEEALPVIQKALDLAQEIGDLGQELEVLNMYAMILTGLKRFDEAIEIYLKMINNYELFQFTKVKNAVNNIEFCYKVLGEYEKFHFLIIDLLRKAHQAEKDLWVIRWTAGYYAESCFRLGKYQEALKSLETVLPIVEKLGNRVYQVNYLKTLGLFSAIVGDTNSAYRYLKSAQACSEDLETSNFKASVWLISALVSGLIGDASELAMGIKQAEKGISIFSQTDYDISWDCFLIVAKLHFACQHEDEAMAALEEALEVYETLTWDGDFALIPPEALFSFASDVYRFVNPEKAEMYLRKAFERVMLVSGKFEDEELRRSYLENVPEIPKVMQEARARGWVTA